MKNVIIYQKNENLNGIPILAIFPLPQNHQNQQQQKMIMFQTIILALEVSQKLEIAFPCCMGVIVYFDSHAAWECDFSLLRHLPSENAIFLTFAARPQPEAQFS